MQGSEAASRDEVLDLTECDREPIHISDAIQPHGVLFGISPADWHVSAVSENVPLNAQLSPGDLLGTQLAQVIDQHSFGQVAAAKLLHGNSLVLPRMRLSTSAAEVWRATLHAWNGDLLLEAEPVQADADARSIERFEHFHAAMVRLQSARAFNSTCQSLATEVRWLTGYGRVMLYRFAQDWSGEVIAEDSDGSMPSYLGLHFPASDIPVQARALYTSNRTRQIPDVTYTKVKLLHGRRDPVDLSPAALRSVSPLHLAYLRNMGVGASMSLSLLHKGKLWGMVACHHPHPHAVTADQVRVCTLLSEWAMAQLGLIEEAELARTNVAVKTLEARMLEEASIGEDESIALFQAELLRCNHAALLGLLGASGLALSAAGSVVSFGCAPSAESLRKLLARLRDRGPQTLVTDHLAGVFPDAGEMGAVAGVLAVPLGEAPDEFLIWFRPELARSVTWAGNPEKPVLHRAGQDRLTPRQSFAAWTEQVRGRSKPWSAADVAAANSLRDALTEIVARRARVMQRMNLQLLRSNEELQSFAYVASHDLKEPLRQIEMFGTLLQRAFGREGDAPEKIERWFAGISTSTHRLRGLIDHLAQFSRLGSEARPFARTDMNALLNDVLEDFHCQMTECGCEIEIGPLPDVTCDAIQIRQVLQNLISNAIKYRHPDRRLVVRISATLCELSPHEAAMAIFRVEDNGIGFDERYKEQIFKPFERLHSAEKYEGNGLGLAICGKVIVRHGGTISASSRPGAGSAFTFSLPQRAGFSQDVQAA